MKAAVPMLFRRTSGVLARRGFRATALQMGGMSPPLPPFARIPPRAAPVRVFILFLLYRSLSFSLIHLKIHVFSCLLSFFRFGWLTMYTIFLHVHTHVHR
jgi:hypothetical protein